MQECLPPCEGLVNGSITDKMDSQEEIVMIIFTSLKKIPASLKERYMRYLERHKLYH